MDAACTRQSCPLTSRERHVLNFTNFTTSTRILQIFAILCGEVSSHYGKCKVDHGIRSHCDSFPVDSDELIHEIIICFRSVMIYIMNITPIAVDFDVYDIK